MQYDMTACNLMNTSLLFCSVLFCSVLFSIADSPGFNINFENAPFKLTREYLEVRASTCSNIFQNILVLDRSQLIAVVLCVVVCVVQVMGGVDSAGFKQFEELFVKGFYALQRHADGLAAIVQVCVACPPD